MRVSASLFLRIENRISESLFTHQAVVGLLELERPKLNLEIPIRGTEKLKTPKWLSRKDLTWFVRYLDLSGAYPIKDVFKGLRISFDGEQLPEEKRRAWFKHAQIWQNILRSAKADRVTTNSDSNNLARYKEHGKSFRNTPSNSPRNSQKVCHF